MSARKLTGYGLLLLALLILASMPLSLGFLDHDPRDRDEIAGFLGYVHDNQVTYGTRMGLLLLKDTVVSVALAAGLYLSFAAVNRGLALVGAAGWLVASAVFFMVDASEATMLVLADDYATAPTETILENARLLAVLSGLTGQAAFAGFSVSLAGFGALFLRQRGAAVPLGYLSLVIAAAWLLLWTSVFTDAGFVFLPIGAIGTIVWLLGVGVYLVRNPEPLPVVESTDRQAAAIAS
jgi:hypothetical protein